MPIKQAVQTPGADHRGGVARSTHFLGARYATCERATYALGELEHETAVLRSIV